MDHHLLADRLYRAAAGALGSGEHLQIAGLLREARRTVVDRQAALELRKLLDNDPWAIEANLDAILPPETPEWFEWPLETRAGHGGGGSAVTGCLLAPHPQEPGTAIVVTGWEDGTGIARHAYAVAMIDIGHLYEHAYAARTRFSRTPDESLERMMASVSVYMPQGFGDEIDILTDGSPQAREAAMRDATAEIPFLLALIVTRHSKGGFVSSEENGAVRLSLAPPIKPGLLACATAWLARRPVPSISRRVRGGTVELSWLRGLSEIRGRSVSGFLLRRQGGS